MIKITAAMTAALTLAGCVTTDQPSAIQIKVGSPRPQNGAIGGTAVEVTAANSGRRIAKRIVVGCQFFDTAGALVNTGTIYFNNLAAGASDTNGLLSLSSGVARAICTESATGKGARR
jgi:hypothetical protein